MNCGISKSSVTAVRLLHMYGFMHSNGGISGRKSTYIHARTSNSAVSSPGRPTMKCPEGAGLRWSGNAATREVSGGRATPTVWLGGPGGCCSYSSGPVVELGSLLFCIPGASADFLWNFPPWRRAALTTVLDLSSERKTLGASSKAFGSGVMASALG